MPGTVDPSRLSPPPHPAVSRLGWIDLAKGVCIVLVVLLHATNFMVTRGMADPWWKQVNAVLEPVRMPLFFLTAGMVATGVLRLNFAELLRRRLLPLLYVYGLWVVLRFGYFTAFPAASGTAETSTPLNLLIATVVPTSGLWFLYALVVFAAAAWAMRHVPPVWQVLGACALALATPQLESLDWTWHNMGTLLVFYLAGLHGSVALRAAAPAVRVHHIGIAAAGFTILYALSRHWAGPVIPTAALTVAVSAVGVGAALMLATRMEKVRWLAPIRALGPRTLSIYLLHEIVLGSLLAAATAAGVDFTGGVVSASGPVVVTVVACIGSLLLHAVFVRRGAGWLFRLPARR
ncbi:acyltransferase family protein [Rhodococcus zopfii]|uniref:acyltransferase family protein n=1 Tax=Rhodococcus zopfii TaxID=43772 RepID=UPI000AC62D6D|nr:acyltransferase family protein [Rhodococcus zopfii]